MSRHDFRGAMSGGTPEMQNLWLSICDDHDKKQADYVARVRALGAKMAHPNDGWVDRERNIARPSYPYFDDGAEVGDLICLGFYSGDPRNALWGRVTEKRRWMGSSPEYHFDRVECPPEHEQE